jgi:peptidoglycan hydrolase-like protein with peptidoglycan-binding domain
MTTITPDPPPGSRRERRERRAASKGGRIRIFAIASAVVLGTGVAVGIGMAAGGAADPSTDAATVRHVERASSTTSTAPPTTTTTLPALRQPSPWVLPSFTGSLGPGSDRAVVQAYQKRLADLRFDPGPVDGTYSQATQYAVQTVQKIYGLPITGRLGGQEALALAVFQYPAPLQSNGEGNRTEVDVTKQVITLYRNNQPRLVTTTSTGSGEHYCYSSPRVHPTRRICEVATTPSGRYTYTRWVKGWDKSPLGQLYQPYYFNGGIAIHGYSTVPTTPASHGCARIPMHIAEYFPMLVKVGDPVYVFGGQPAQILSSRAI